MRTSPAIARYDRLMLRDLGSAPVYSWKWSEDLLHVMDEINPHDGKPVYRPTLQNGIYAVRQQTTTRRWPGIWQQWVVCALIELNANDGAVHGTGVAAWVPVYDKRSRPVCVPENVQPNQSHTEAFIRKMRAYRVREAEAIGKWEDHHKPNTTPMDESERNTLMMSRAEKKKFDIARDAIKDGFTAFGEVPGVRGSTSWPTTGKDMAGEFVEYQRGLEPEAPVIVAP